MGHCSFYEMGDYDLVIELLQAALDTNRVSPGVYKYLAFSYQANADLDKAIEAMNKAVLYEMPYPWEEENRGKAFKRYEELCSERNSKSQ
jgi:tetratricopeptide (TPR) repeat protein